MKLFEPVKISKLQVKNRLYMLPMRPVLLDSDGALSQRAIDFYIARAKGGVGIICSSVWMIERSLEAKMEDTRCVYPMADGRTYIDRISQLADSLHDYDTRLVAQLSAGFGRILPPWCYSWQAPRQPFAPSDQPWMYDPAIIARGLTKDEIHMLVERFGAATNIMTSSNVDAIEIHGTSGYLIDQFLTPAWNHRTDEYGGNLDGRLRLLLEIIEEIKSASHNNIPVIFRYSLFHDMPDGRDLDEGLEVARRLEQAGIDAISVAVGCHESKLGRQHTPFTPLGLWAEYAAEVKKVVKIPIIAAGRLGFPDLAEDILKTNKADLIGLGRPLLADPDWPNKVKGGREEEIIYCIACGDGCQARTNQNKYISCALNPLTGMEKELAITKAEKKKNVLVIGGGPSGMEAARVLALRGHEVTLWEKTEQLGGNLIPAAVPDFKRDLITIIDRLSRLINQLGVKVQLGKEATVKAVDEMKPDVIFIATGSKHVLPMIPGIENEFVMTASELLLGQKRAGDNVVVIGGGAIGAETALHIAQAGKHVTLVEMLSTIAMDVFDESRKQLLHLLDNNGIKILTGSTVKLITAKGVVVSSDQGNQTLRADTVVLAVGMKAENRLLEDLHKTQIEVVPIGDCVKPGKIIDAIWTGFRKARVA